MEYLATPRIHLTRGQLGTTLCMVALGLKLIPTSFLATDCSIPGPPLAFTDGVSI